MIRLNQNAANEAVFQIELLNEWTISILPHPDGTATLLAWDSHSSRPGKHDLVISHVPRGATMDGATSNGDDLVDFIQYVAGLPIGLPSTEEGSDGSA